MLRNMSIPCIKDQAKDHAERAGRMDGADANIEELSTAKVDNVSSVAESLQALEDYTAGGPVPDC